MRSRTAATPRERTESGVARTIRRVIGAGLLALVVFPVYRLLDSAHTGLAGGATVGLADIFYEFTWTGLLLVLPVAILAAFLLTPSSLDRFGARASALLLRPGSVVYIGTCALVAAVLTGAFSLLVLDGKPNLVDAFAQLLHARYWAEGMLAGPADELGAFWGMQNAVLTPNGWVSQYPPGHIALLVPFFLIGMPWLLGPLLVFVAVVGAGLLANRLFPEDLVVARLGVALVALSPFFLFLSGAFMNHATSAACMMIGAWALLRAWMDERARWAVLTGFVLALSLATRPLSTLAMSLALIVAVPVLWPRPLRQLVRTAAAGVIGAAPVLALWFAYNDQLFGSPLRLGYNVAHGPSMALGFHRDPWGNLYGVREAVGYTSSDLVTLGTHLFESPVSAVLLIGVFLFVARALPRGVWLLLVLAIAPVLSNALYWHHGIFMGPRMLHEAAPVWALLSGVAAVGLVRRVPAAAALAGRYFLKPAVAGALVSALAIGLLYMAPLRAQSYGGDWMAIARTPLPDPGEPAIVFVHDAWYGRVATTLAAEGVRLDLVETLLRQNPTCHVHHLASALASGDTGFADRLLARLDTVPRAERAIPEHDGIRTTPGETLTPACRREMNSDRYGVTDISPLLWQADLHGTPGGTGVLIARDLGPERNQAMIRRHPDRAAYVYVTEGDASDVRLMAYDEGMRLLWAPNAGDGLQPVSAAGAPMP